MVSNSRFLKNTIWTHIFFLTGIFLFGIILLFAQHLLFSHLKNKFEVKTSNEQARISIGEKLIQDIKQIEADFYRMATRIELSAQQNRQKSIVKNLNQIRSLLHVIEKGGEIETVLLLNLPEQDEMIRHFSYEPMGKEKYIIPIIELRPALVEIEERVQKLAEMLKLRALYKKSNNKAYVAIIKDIKDFLKMSGPLFNRMIENANKLFYKSNLALEKIKKQAEIHNRRYLILEISSIVLIMLGALMMVYFVITDISLLNSKLQKKIVESEHSRKELEKLSAAIQQSPVSIVITDNQGNIEYVNPKFVELTGYSRQEAAGKNPRILKSGMQSRETYEQLWKTIQSGRAWNGEFVNIKKNGDRYWENAVISPIFDDNGVITNFLAVKEDISEKKQIEIELKKSEQKFRNLFNSITDLVYTQDLEGRFITINPSMGEILGYDQDYIIGRKVTDFMEPEFQTGFTKRYIDKIKGKGYHEGVGSYLNKNGEKRYLEYRSSLVKHADDIEKSFISGVARDITEKILSEEKVKKLQQQVAQSQKIEAVGTLAGGIAHDFNNILSGILGYAYLALMDIDKPEKAKNQITQIQNGAQRAAELVQQILTFSRHSESKKQPLSIAPLIKEALKLLRSTIPSNIEIKEDIKSKAIILADSTKIHQVVMNLCTNAYHAMSETGGTLTVGLKKVEITDKEVIPDMNIKADTYLRLTITDTGQGMDDEVLTKIFDPYYTTKEIGKGTGLGLSVVDGIVKNHNGFIKLYSNVGFGSTFEVYWPVIKEKKSLFVPDIKGPELSTGNERILVVDDEVQIIDIVKQILTRQGYKVVTYDNGRSALKAFTKRPEYFDLVITDMMMPKMTGKKLSEEMLKIRQDIPIIICTGYNEDFSNKNALEIGITKFIEKPITGDKLIKTIQDVLDDNKS